MRTGTGNITMRKWKRIGRLCAALILALTMLCFCGMSGLAQGTESGNDTVGEGMQESREKQFSMDGTPPEMPDGEQFGGRGAPQDGEEPDGMGPGMGGFPGGMQGDFQPGELPDGTMPQDGDFGGRFNFGNGDFTGGFGGEESFPGRNELADGGSQPTAGNIDLETVILLGVSFAVLIGGLLFAKFYG